MADELNLLRRLEPAVRPAGTDGAGGVKGGKGAGGASFEALLKGMTSEDVRRTAEPLKLSGHAMDRLRQRGVELSANQMQALSESAAVAESKGARDALMMMGDLGMVVNIPNRTVLTVLPEDRMKSGVVTQIDSAVIVDEKAGAQEQVEDLSRLNRVR